MNYSRNVVYSFIALLLFSLVGCNLGKTPKDQTSLAAKLTATSEVPASNSNGQGTLKGEVNSKTSLLTWTINYSGLSGPVTGAHFHGPALEGKNADVAVPITGSLASPINGTATLSTTQLKELMEGKWYVNLHTAANPNGEIRGQITK
jgi:hypothetical protein